MPTLARTNDGQGYHMSIVSSSQGLPHIPLNRKSRKDYEENEGDMYGNEGSGKELSVQMFAEKDYAPHQTKGRFLPFHFVESAESRAF